MTISGQGKSLPLPSYKTLRNALQGVLEASGVDRHITFHGASVSTTQIYAQVLDEKVNEAMETLDKV